MKKFQDLEEEVQKTGLCRHCGGCVNFCTAINYGALDFDKNGIPFMKDSNKCIECGLCYTICPETHELEEELNRKFNWTAPMGNYIKILAAQSKDPKIRSLATNGGVVTSLLVFLLDRGYIDGAIVSRQKNAFSREPHLASTKQDILESAGFNLEHSHGMQKLSQKYSTYSSSIEELRPMMQQGLKRVAFVGLPCQINTVRKMQALGIVPSDSINYYLGLFCSGTFVFGEEERKELERLADFKWQQLKKINIKEDLMLHLYNGEIKHVSLEKLDFMKRYACHFCSDYSAEYADISFGGLGAQEGWTTVVLRTATGRKIYQEALNRYIQEYSEQDKSEHLEQITRMCRRYSMYKKDKASDMRKTL